MKGKIFLFVGIILIIVGVIIMQSNIRVKVNNRTASVEESNEIKNYIAAGVGGLGVLFLVIGVIGMVKGSKQKSRNLNILNNGIEAAGTVTFVDKNYAILVNKKPIYSILEYTYYDKNGRMHTRRINNLNSDVVIRLQIQVGSSIPVKYSAENPSESVIVL